MSGYRGKHRKPSTGGRTLATTALAGAAVVGTPLVLASPASAATDTVWDNVAHCESGGRWNINTGNGYSGGLQFAPRTWTGFGGAEFAQMAHQATREQQIMIAERVLAKQGWGAWPVCSHKAGAVGQPATQRSAPAAPAPKPAAPKPAAPKPPAAPPQHAAPTLIATVAPAAGTVAPKHEAGAMPPGTTYVVRPGDTLSAIAEANEIAGGWQRIFEQNRALISDPNLIFPDQKFVLG
jgi:hypothetical protein